MSDQNKNPVVWYAAGRIERSRFRFDLVECSLHEREGNTVEIRHTNLKGEHPNIRFGYSGPFTLGCDHGCSHKPEDAFIPAKDWFSEEYREHGFGSVSHGSGEDCAGEGFTKEKVFARSLEGIRKADCVFAWIDDNECFGTLVELGYAFALNKPIYIGYAKGISLTGELWFALQTGNCRQFDSAKEAWSAAILHAEVTNKMKQSGGAK